MLEKSYSFNKFALNINLETVLCALGVWGRFLLNLRPMFTINTALLNSWGRLGASACGRWSAETACIYPCLELFHPEARN